MIRTIEAWQCIGCGKIEAPQPCIGVCQDARIVMVGINNHQQALATVGELGEQLRQAQALLSRLALSTPRDGQWERSYRAFQQQARSLLKPPPLSSTSLAMVGKEEGQ